jgi:DNA-binding HxlR family transcriptional regulator
VIHSLSTNTEKIMRVAELLQGKWTVHILCVMCHGPVRLGQLKRSVPGASKKALTSSLRSLEDGRVVVRRDLSTSILHVEYELSEELGGSIRSLLDFLAQWSSHLPGESK